MDPAKTVLHFGLLHHNRAEPLGSAHKGGNYASLVYDRCDCVCVGSFSLDVGDDEERLINF